MSSSGKNILAQNNTWVGGQTFSNPTQFSTLVTFLGNMRYTANHLTGATTLGSFDMYNFCDATTAAFTVTLPASAVNGSFYQIMKVDVSANAVTVSGNGANINGAASQSLAAQFAKITVVFDSTAAAWFQVA